MADQTPPIPNEGWAAIGAAVVTGVGVVIRQLIKSRLPRRTAAPDPVTGFGWLVTNLQEQVTALTTENRQLRVDMDSQERECERRLAAMHEQVVSLRSEVASLTRLLARHGITGEAGP